MEEAWAGWVRTMKQLRLLNFEQMESLSNSRADFFRRYYDAQRGRAIADQLPFTTWLSSYGVFILDTMLTEERMAELQTLGRATGVESLYIQQQLGPEYAAAFRSLMELGLSAKDIDLATGLVASIAKLPAEGYDAALNAAITAFVSGISIDVPAEAVLARVQAANTARQAAIAVGAGESVLTEMAVQMTSEGFGKSFMALQGLANVDETFALGVLRALQGVEPTADNVDEQINAILAGVAKQSGASLQEVQDAMSPALDYFATVRAEAERVAAEAEFARQAAVATLDASARVFGEMGFDVQLAQYLGAAFDLIPGETATDYWERIQPLIKRTQDVLRNMELPKGVSRTPPWELVNKLMDAGAISPLYQQAVALSEAPIAGLTPPGVGLDQPLIPAVPTAQATGTVGNVGEQQRTDYAQWVESVVATYPADQQTGVRLQLYSGFNTVMNAFEMEQAAVRPERRSAAEMNAYYFEALRGTLGNIPGINATAALEAIQAGRGVAEAATAGGITEEQLMQAINAAKGVMGRAGIGEYQPTRTFGEYLRGFDVNTLVTVPTPAAVTRKRRVPFRFR